VKSEEIPAVAKVCSGRGEATEGCARGDEGSGNGVTGMGARGVVGKAESGAAGTAAKAGWEDPCHAGKVSIAGRAAGAAVRAVKGVKAVGNGSRFQGCGRL